jgi:hypothetical protein
MRVDIKSILSDPEKRKEVIVGACVFLQAVERRVITRERAEEAYERVRFLASQGRFRDPDVPIGR